MGTSVSDQVERHVVAAKCLLAELDEKAKVALAALMTINATDGAEFFGALEARDRLLAELEAVVGALSHEPGWNGAHHPELAAAAAAALESQAELHEHMRVERERLATALQQVERPDVVASQYAPMPAQRRPMVSVIG